MIVDIAGAIDAYGSTCSVKRDAATLLGTICKDVWATKLDAVDYEWAAAWVLTQKVEYVRAPTRFVVMSAPCVKVSTGS